MRRRHLGTGSRCWQSRRHRCRPATTAQCRGTTAWPQRCASSSSEPEVEFKYLTAFSTPFPNLLLRLPDMDAAFMVTPDCGRIGFTTCKHKRCGKPMPPLHHKRWSGSQCQHMQHEFRKQHTWLTGHVVRPHAAWAYQLLLQDHLCCVAAPNLHSCNCNHRTPPIPWHRSTSGVKPPHAPQLQVWHYTRGLALAARVRAPDGWATAPQLKAVTDEQAAFEV